MESRIYNVNLQSGYNTLTYIGISQYDAGVPLQFNVYDGATAASFPAGTTAKIQGVRPSGVGFNESCTLTDNVVTVDSSTDMTGEAGKFPAEIRFEYSGVDVGTVNFIFLIEKAPHPDGTIDADITREQTFIERLEEVEDVSHLYRGVAPAGALTANKQTGFYYINSTNAYTDLPISGGISAVLIVYNMSGTKTGNLRQQTIITLPNSTAGFQYGMYTRYIQSSGTALAWKRIGADQTNVLAYKGLGNTLTALSQATETGVLFISTSYTLSDSPLPSGVGGMLITINAGGPRIQFVTGNTSGDSVIFMRFISSGGAVGAWYDIGIDRNDLFGYKGQSSALSPASVADITQSGFWFVSASQGLSDMPISGQGGLLEVINLSGGVIVQKFYCTNLAGYPEFSRYKPSSGSFGAWRVMGENAPSVAKWVAFGDSITEGIGGSAGDPYVKRIAYQKGYNLTNKGAGGTGYIKVHEDGTATEQMSAFDFTGYDLCTIAYGTNDWRDNCVLGSAADAAGTNTVCAALKKCVEIAMTSNDAMKIIVILPFNRVRVSSAFTPTPSIDTNWCYGVRNTAGYTLSEMCDALIDTCKTLGVQYIDSRTESPINVYNIDTLLADELHPSDIGNRMIARNYADKITY